MPKEVPKVSRDNMFLSEKERGLSAGDAARKLIATVDDTLTEYVAVYDREEIDDHTIEFNLIAVIVAVRNARMQMETDTEALFVGPIDDAPQEVRDLIGKLAEAQKIDLPDKLAKELGIEPEG